MTRRIILAITLAFLIMGTATTTRVETVAPTIDLLDRSPVDPVQPTPASWNDDEGGGDDESDDGNGDDVCACPQTCGGPEGILCEEGQYCKRAEGECSEVAEGECAPLSAVCSPIIMEVCGCDGRTYSNACFAAAAGVTVETPGPCVQPVACGGTAGDTCEDGQYCRQPVGQCSEDAEGICRDAPTVCPSNLAPVCGCDGTTYDNACLAAAAGVSIEAQGACGSVGQACGGGAAACGEGQFCLRPLGECTEDAEGVCTSTSAACPTFIAPVCGCDGTTYDNACVAHGAGVSVASDGACASGQACGGEAGECGEGEFCNRPRGECTDQAEGACTTVPSACPTHFAPVCGCDGMTYPNPCFAAGAGVSVSKQGPCKNPIRTTSSRRRGF